MKRILCFVFSVLFCFSSLIAEPKNADKPLPSGPKPKDRPSVALVLAGGGAKGFAHLPVIEMIEEVGIPIDMVVGTSIGSIIGGLYSAGYSTQEILNGFDNIDWSTMFLDNAQSPYEGTLNDYSLNRNIFVLNFGDDFSIKLGKGLSSGQNVYQLLKNMTLKYPSDTDFNNLTIPFRAVATDMLTGEALVLDEGDLAEAIRASMSLPSIFEPAEVDGHYFMDGGIRYNLAINVAKNMGYDIIIAVDISQKIRDNPEVYSSTPAVAMLNTITISQYTATQAMYKDASLVIIPDISNYGTLDFKNAQKIYDEGKKIRETYMPELEKLRRKIFPSDYDSAGNRLSKMDSVKKRGNYRRRSNLIPTEIEINGALERDKPFIYNSFKAIYDEELTPENFEPFMKKIYMTGNYTSVRPRIYERDDATVLSLNLKQKDKREEKIVVGAEMVQTVAPTMMSVFNLKLQGQIRGLTGPSSVLAVAGTAINDFGAELYYLQPFNPYFFMAAGAEYMDKRYPQMPVSLDNFKFMETSFSTYRTFDSNLCFGFRTDNGNLLRLEGYYNYRRTSTLASLYDELEYYVLIHDDLYKDGIRQPENWDPEFLRLDDEYITFLSDGVYVRSAGVLADYEFDHMDRYSFAHSGIYLNAIADLQFAFNTYVTDPALCLSLDIKDAIPLGKHISINTSLFAGMDVLDNIRRDVRLKLAAGFNRFDRVFFPQYTDESHFGAIKAACEVSIQIEPWSKLTILGGDAIIRLNGTFGNVVNSWDQFIPVTKKDSKIYPLCWTASAGFGVKFKEGYDLYLRVGAASNQKIDYTSDDVTKVIPFFALDLGSVKF